MKKRVVSLFLSALILLFAVAGYAQETMTPGTYTVVCPGYYGDFDVTVTVSDEAITAITVGEYKDTEAIGGEALRMMTTRMLDSNTAMVDTVSGATVTSILFRNAVMQALKEAGAPAALTTALEAPEKSDETLDTDVLVIGAGAAGFTAAIAAKNAGADVILIEKQDLLGGSTMVSAGIVYAALDKEDESKMIDYYMERSEGTADLEMLQVFAENSMENISFLDDIGVQWMMAIPAGTAPEPRAHFSMHEDGRRMIGSALIDPLESKALEMGITILRGVKATQLMQENDVIVGALAESKEKNYTLNAKAVVMATGGFDASAELVETYAPVAKGDIVLSNKGNVGEGLLMALEVGAKTEFKGGMIGFQAVNQGLPDSGYNAVAMNSPLFVQADGTFITVGADYPINYTRLKESGASAFYGIYDAAGEENGERALAVNFGFKADTVEELAAAAGMEEAKLVEAVAKNEALTTAPYYAVVVRPATIGSMGGIVTNTAAEVLSETTGEPIAGFYAAGEVANSAFYGTEYPASGSSISISMAFGRIAGIQAAEYIKGK